MTGYPAAQAQNQNQSRLGPLLLLAITFGVGLAFGFFAGVASTDLGRDFLWEIARVEVPANMQKTKVHSRENFAFEYPSNWQIDTQDQDFDPDWFIALIS